MRKILKNWSLVLQNSKLGPRNSKIWKIFTIFHHLSLLNYRGKGWNEIRVWGAERGMGGFRVKIVGEKEKKYKNCRFLIRLAAIGLRQFEHICPEFTIRIWWKQMTNVLEEDVWQVVSMLSHVIKLIILRYKHYQVRKRLYTSHT